MTWGYWPPRSGWWACTSTTRCGKKPKRSWPSGSGKSGFARLADCQQQAQQRNHHKADKGPVGNRATQEGPVNLGAVAATLEDHGNGALEREGLNHSIKIAAARRDFGRVPL